MSSEAKVGMFFLIALVLVGVIALYLGDFWVRARSYPVTVYFENVQGLPSGAEVRFAGVRVGRVTEVKLESNPKFPSLPAAVRMAIFHDTVLYKTDGFVVQQSALLGDKYVEVKRSPAHGKRVQLAAGSEIAGGRTVGIESMTEEVRGLIGEAKVTLTAVRETLASQYNQEAIHLILGNVVAATGKANALAAQALRLANILTVNAAKTGPNVAAMADNLREASVSVKNTAQLVRQLLATSPVPKDISVASGNIRQATADMAAISDNMAKVLANPETRAQMQDALNNLHQSTDHLATITGQAAKLFEDEGVGKDIRETLARLREAATNISSITATYDKLLTDPSFTTDVRQTVTAARTAAESGSRAIQRAENSLTRVDETMERVTQVTRTFNPDEVRASASLEATRHRGLRADVKADLQYGKNRNDFWRVGVRDVGDAETLILQKSFSLGANRARAGIYGNKIGLGYDLNPTRRLTVETELWNPDDPRLDLRGTYSLTPRVDALLGFDDLASDTEPFVGIRYRSNSGR